MEVVKHGEWFTVEDSETGKKYQMILLDCGFTYSTVSIREIVATTRPKYLFFGPRVASTKRVYIVTDSRGQGIGPVIDRELVYPINKAKQIFLDIIFEIRDSVIVNTIKL